VVVAEDDVVAHDFVVVGNDVVVDGVRGRFGFWLALGGGWNGLKVQRRGLCYARCRTAGEVTGEEITADGRSGGVCQRRWSGRVIGCRWCHNYDGC
jgi:hypothetical protein